MLDRALDRPRWLDARLNRFPFKHAWDALALVQVWLRPKAPFELPCGEKHGFDWKAKLDCTRFYFSGGDIGNLYATLSRSGYNWTLLGIAIARDLARGGDGEYEFTEEFWFPRHGICYAKLDWRTPTGTLGLPLDSPELYHSANPYFRIRCGRLKQFRIGVGLRSIYDSMESKYFKHMVMLRKDIPSGYIIPDSHESPAAENEYNFDWDKLLGEAIEFFNSWGDVMTWHPRTRLFRYEDLNTDPVDAHKDLTDFFGLNLPRDCLAEAFRRITKEEMRKHLPRTEDPSTMRVAYRASGDSLSAERVSYIERWLERRLRYDFGYGKTWSGHEPRSHG